MGCCLIALVSWSLVVVIVKVAVGLGAVIFVHELGHFLVAKLCGVRCDKFYLGFDIGGLKLLKCRWGETEYGIGILPLGGYVKMLGQEDNPARLREEIERAKKPGEESATAAADATDPPAVAGAGAEPSAAADEAQQSASGAAPAGSEGDAAAAASSAAAMPAESAERTAADEALFDPRSFLAKSVPQRMAIISAGVVMNVIFAFITAVIAYRMGVKQTTPAVGGVLPGRPAWQMGFRVGDQIVEIGGKRIERFSDLQKMVSLSQVPPEGIEVVLQRPKPDGTTETITRYVHPTKGGLIPTIGVVSYRTTQLIEEGLPCVPGSAAEKAQPPLRKGDTIVAVDGRKIDSYAQLHAEMAARPAEPMRLTVMRGKESLDVVVPPNPMRRLGIEMTMGEIRAVEENSPAAQAGIRPGDLLCGMVIEPEGPTLPLGDPMTLPSRLRAYAGKTIELVVQREGQPNPSHVAVSLRQADWFEQPLAPGSPMSIPELGVAYRVLNRVAAVIPDSPADKAGVKVGDLVRSAVILPPDPIPPEYADYGQRKGELEFGDKQRNWPFLIYELQQLLPGTKVVLELESKAKAELTVMDSADWFNPDRGFRLGAHRFVEGQDSLGSAVRLGARETWESLTMVIGFIRKLADGSISVRGLGGPITIAGAAGRAASEGYPQLLLFLTVLGANLAVLNFLPIPMLDGGHMVFLLYEGIRGKPADERVQLALTYLGLAFLLGLMLLVFGLDLGLISRDLPVE